MKANKIFALILALSMVLMLCACGGGGTTTPATDTPASQPPVTTDEGTPTDEGNTTVSIPVASDFAAGPEWTIDVEPNKDNGPWSQSYDVIDALAEAAKAYDGVTAERTFTLACHDPADSAPGEFLTAWANAVTIATEGKIDFNIGYSGALSGTMASLDDMKSGTIDFDWTLPCYFKGYMPYTNVIQNAGLGIDNATSGSYTMWELYKSNDVLQAEFADHGELLFVWTNCTSPLSYKGDHEISSVSEIKGNIRGNNGPAQTLIAEVGASVFSCAIGDVYTNVSTGIINYLITDWHGIKSFSLSDEGILNYYVDTNIGSSAYCLMANSDVWASISSELQDAIKSVSGDYLLNLVSIWDYWEAAGRYQATANGGTIFEPGDEFAAELQTAYDNVAQTWISEQKDPAVAQDLYDQAIALVNKYNAEFGW